MNCNWQTMTLAEAGITLIDCDHKTPKAQESGFPYIGIPQLKDCRITLDGARLICEEDFNHWRRKAKPQEHDIIMSRRCNPGETGYVTADLNIALGQNLVLLRSDGKTVYPPFLRWLTRGPYWWNQVNTFINVGAVFESLKCADIPNFEVKVPSIEEQKKICNCLSALDDKISLNIKTNQTLEQMAQAIFKSWFVDFDPVKAKMNGEQPEGMDAATAALFPDKLVESELGLIPEGWEIKPIKDLCSKVQNGGTPKRSESSYWDDGDIPWLTSGEVRQSIITSVENRITQLGLDKSSAKWVPELSTLVALYGATAGEVSLTSIPLTTNQAVCALMPKKEHQWYNYLQLKSRVAELAGKAVGSAQQNISKGLVESTEVLSVPESLLEAFNAQVENLFKLRICNLQESVELANLRDTLLPKLLSGEIELGETEEMAEVN
ncbi:restriction endonuclease subunit S [Vibrio alginolyticus]|uniref:restriction endonuclease subunit S n=1 Tax=Vibrio alginolyticus TaxID=663 RepID=UPI001BD5D645|nr:restriction endonuclease subunit S [Vibrio alginolyticus]MBS9907646.1 restriction endonuclease subunit S [Vibrio alginolyticus]MBS9985548.1 restriction endonuclease subunit S [Vibrio alginolyticus]